MFFFLVMSIHHLKAIYSNYIILIHNFRQNLNTTFEKLNYLVTEWKSWLTFDLSRSTLLVNSLPTWYRAPFDQSPNQFNTHLNISIRIKFLSVCQWISCLVKYIVLTEMQRTKHTCIQQNLVIMPLDEFGTFIIDKVFWSLKVLYTI